MTTAHQSSAQFHPAKLRHDNGDDHRAGTIDLNIEKTRKSGFACIVLLLGVIGVGSQQSFQQILDVRCLAA